MVATTRPPPNLECSGGVTSPLEEIGLRIGDIVATTQHQTIFNRVVLMFGEIGVHRVGLVPEVVRGLEG